MKVLVIPTWYTEKSKPMSEGIFHFEQSLELNKLCDVRLFFPFDREVSGLSESVENGLYTYRSPIRSNKVVQVLDAIKSFDKIYKAFKPDIIHSHVAFGAGLIAVLIGKKYNIPVVDTEHNPIEFMNLESKIHWKADDYVYKNTMANICVSSDSQEKLTAKFPKRKFELIYNGVIDPNTIRKDGLKYKRDGAINFSIVASFYDKEVKGYQYLLPAVKKNIEKGNGVCLHICGGGTYLEYYKSMANEIGINENCVFYGQCNREKVYSIVSQMDFCVSTSLFECSGVSVEEALLLGKPMMVTKSGGANSLCTEDNAVVVESGSVDAIVDGIEEIIRRLPEFEKSSIREYAYNNFEIKKTSEKYYQLFHSILNN